VPLAPTFTELLDRISIGAVITADALHVQRKYRVSWFPPSGA